MSTLNIAKESVPQFFAGQGTVGTSEIPLTLDLPVAKFVTIKAGGSNNNWIKIGPRGHASSGFPLLAGEESPPIYAEHLSQVALVAGGSNQTYSWIAS